MTVILMTHEAGADGDAVAAAIAQCLGIELVRREHLERQIAERLRIDEGAVRRMLAGDASLLERWTIDRGRLRHAMTEQVAGLAVQGDVLIQTWSIAPVLRSVRHLICFHLRAPMLARECFARRSPTTGEGGMAAETHNSEAVSLPIDGKLSHGLSDVELYDLVINADRICVAQCVEQVRRLTLDPLFQPTVASQRLLASLMRETGRSSQPIFGLGGTRVAPLPGSGRWSRYDQVAANNIERRSNRLRGAASARKEGLRRLLTPTSLRFQAQQASFGLSTDLVAARAIR